MQRTCNHTKPFVYFSMLIFSIFFSSSTKAQRLDLGSYYYLYSKGNSTQNIYYSPSQKDSAILTEKDLPLIIWPVVLDVRCFAFNGEIILAISKHKNELRYWKIDKTIEPMEDKEGEGVVNLSTVKMISRSAFESTSKKLGLSCEILPQD